MRLPKTLDRYILCACILVLIWFAKGCRWPSYMEVSPGYSRGNIDGNRSAAQYDQDGASVFVTVGWNLNEQYKAMRNLSELDVSKSGEMLVRNPAIEVVSRDDEKGNVTIHMTENEGENPDAASPTNLGGGVIATIITVISAAILAVGKALTSKTGSTNDGLDEPSDVS